MSIFTTIGSVAGAIFRVGKIILPILAGLRQASPDVDEWLDKVDAVIEAGGTEADDFFDRNIGTIHDMAEVFSDLEDLAVTGQELTEKIIQYSQVDVPNQITPEQAADIGQSLLEMKAHIQALVTSQELMEKLEKMQ
jgi:hypothetical protein